MKKRPVDDRLGRRVGREPQCLVARVADVICTERVLAFRAAIVGGGIDANADVRLSAHRPHLTHQQLGTEQLAVLLVARTEIGDLDAATLRIVEAGDEYGGIGEILLLGFDRPLQLNRERAAFVARRVSGQ